MNKNPTKALGKTNFVWNMANIIFLMKVEGDTSRIGEWFKEAKECVIVGDATVIETYFLKSKNLIWPKRVDIRTIHKSENDDSNDEIDIQLKPMTRSWKSVINNWNIWVMKTEIVIEISLLFLYWEWTTKATRVHSQLKSKFAVYII